MSRTECPPDAMECDATPCSTIFVLVRGSTIIVPGPDSTIFVPIQGSTIIVPWKVSTIFVLYVFSTNFVLLSVSVLFCSSSLIYKEKLLLQSLCSKFRYTNCGPGFGEISWFSGWGTVPHLCDPYRRLLFHRFLSSAPLGSSRIYPIAGRYSIGFSLMRPMAAVKIAPALLWWGHWPQSRRSRGISISIDLFPHSPWGSCNDF